MTPGEQSHRGSFIIIMTTPIDGQSVDLPNDPEIDETMGRAKLIEQILRQLPQLFAVRTISALSTPVLMKSLDVIGPIIARLQQERSLRNSEGTGVDDAIALLASKYSTVAGNGQAIANVFRTEEHSYRRFEFLRETIEIFRNRGRSTFYLDEMVQIVQHLQCEYFFGPKAMGDPIALRIGIGTALGKPGLTLRSHFGARGRMYMMETVVKINPVTGELL